MAARVAASVVWLTPGAIMTLTSLTSTLTGLAAGLTIFDSGFLFVTEAFNCTEAGFTLASDKFFFVGVTVAFDAAARTALGAGLALDFFAVAAIATFVGDFTAFTAVVAALPVGLAALALETDLVPAAVLATVFVAEGIEVFAGFFIASAIESTAK